MRFWKFLACNSILVVLGLMINISLTNLPSFMVPHPSTHPAASRLRLISEIGQAPKISALPTTEPVR